MNAFFWSFIGVWKRWSNYIFNMKRGTLLYPNETSKECIQFLNNIKQYTVISYLFGEQSKLLTRGAGDDLRTVPKSSPAPFYYFIYMYITTNPLKMMSAYHTIKKLGHNIVLKEIQHFVDYIFSWTMNWMVTGALDRNDALTAHRSRAWNSSDPDHSACYFKNFLVIN